MKTVLLLILIALSMSDLAFSKSEPMRLTSPDIREGDYIPHQFTCQGINISPGLEFVNIPDRAKSLAVIVHDPDAPSGDWTHWVVYNIPRDNYAITQGWVPGLEGRNDAGNNGWSGPCPPMGTHHYIFIGYALDQMLDLKKGALKGDLEKAMQGHILDQAQMTGLYAKF